MFKHPCELTLKYMTYGQTHDIIEVLSSMKGHAEKYSRKFLNYEFLFLLVSDDRIRLGLQSVLELEPRLNAPQ